MARKKKHEEHENLERWLVSYADFITLLFAFFVVMYALSSVNEGKYRVLSDALIAAFRNSPKSMQPIQVGDPLKAPQDIHQELRSTPKETQVINIPVLSTRKIESSGGRAMEVEKENMKRMGDELQRALAMMIQQGLIDVRKKDDRLEVEINTSILFASGSARIQYEAIPTLRDIARIISRFPNSVRVEGFTDNQPISTPVFPSNWELSAGRAASVVHLFADEGVDPARLSAIGYGEYHPIASNTTAEGRGRNRRVVIAIYQEEQKPAQSDPDLPIPAPVPQTDINLDAPEAKNSAVLPGTAPSAKPQTPTPAAALGAELNQSIEKSGMQGVVREPPKKTPKPVFGVPLQGEPLQAPTP